MIFDSLDNLYKYRNISKNFSELVKFIEENSLDKFGIGQYEIKKDEIFFIAKEYSTEEAEDRKWEVHKQYIDVQYIFSGEERMGYANPKDNVISYKIEENDIYLFERDMDRYYYFDMNQGMISIFFPKEIHKPQCSPDKTSKVKKFVFKLKYEE